MMAGQELLMPLITSFMVSSNKSIFSILLLLLINVFLSYSKHIIKYSKFLKYYFNRYSQYTIKAHVTYKNNIIWDKIYPLNFLAVLRKLKHKISNDNSFSNYEIKEFPSDFSKKTITFIELNKKINITDDIKIKTTIEKNNNSNDKIDYEYIILEISLFTYKKNYKIIESFINQCVEDYNVELLDNIKEQHIFEFKSIDKDFQTPNYIEYPLTTTKCFDNMFFDEKDDIIRHINYFMNNKDEYKRLGIPYTLGIMIHGPPGTSKTSFLKSLAKYTKRHIIKLPLNKIKNIEVLHAIFYTEELNYTHIPNNRRIYSFEDVDCGHWKDIVISRNLKKENIVEDNSNNNNVINLMCKMINNDSESDDECDKKKKKISIPEKNTITLADLLDLLDGIIEIDGRIFVMSSNHPEIIDDALKRPGRIDRIIEFGKLSKNNIMDVHKLWFDEDIPLDIYNLMCDNIYTIAEIGQLFSKYRDNLPELHNMLVKN